MMNRRQRNTPDHHERTSKSRVTIIEGGGELLINALIGDMVHSSKYDSNRYNEKSYHIKPVSEYCVFMKGLQKDIRKSRYDFIETMKRMFKGVKYVYVEKRFARIYFFTKAGYDEALEVSTIAYKNLTLSLHPYMNRRSSSSTHINHNNRRHQMKRSYRNNVSRNTHTVHNIDTRSKIKSRIHVLRRSHSSSSDDSTVRTRNK